MAIRLRLFEEKLFKDGIPLFCEVFNSFQRCG